MLFAFLNNLYQRQLRKQTHNRKIGGIVFVNTQVLRRLLMLKFLTYLILKMKQSDYQFLVMVVQVCVGLNRAVEIFKK